MKEFGLQLFTIRDVFQTEDGIRDGFRAMAEYGYSYGQTAGGFLVPPEQFAKYAKDAGISICGTHYSWDAMKNDPDGTMKIHEILGTTNIGIGGMPADARSLEGVKPFIEKANELGAYFAKRGFKFTYHNHAFEFARQADGRTLMDHLVDGLDPVNCSFVLDTYWVQYGGYSVEKMIRRLAGRVDILHLKDMGANKSVELGNGKTMNVPYITEIGNGNLNFDEIIPLAESLGTKYFVVEQDAGFSDGNSLHSIKTSADYIKKYLLK